MQTYKVSGNGVQVSVESDNWLFAVALSLPQLGLDASALDQLVCSMGPDGTVAVMDATNRIPVRIGVEAEDATKLLDIPGNLLELGALEEKPVPAPAALTPARAMGTAPARLAQAMARREEIQAAEDADSACEIALRIVADLVKSESGAVLQRLYQTRSLSFVAAFGPRADRVLGTTLPANTGIAGFSFTSGFGVIVQDVDTDGRFTSTVDRASGYRTRSVLAMPIRVVDGPVFGCLELLNAPEGFRSEDLEIVRVVALALGRRLRVASE